MELGTLLQLEFNDPKASRGKSQLVGMKKGDYLIIELPDEYEQCSRPVFLEEGNSIIIRYINKNGVIYGVKSMIMKTLYSPVKLLIVSSPTVIENHKLRKVKRSSCLLHSYIDVENLLVEGHIINISADGCRLSIDVDKVQRKYLENERTISLSMQMPGVEGVVSINGIIRNVTKENSKFMCGIQFLGVKPKVLDKITEFLKTLEQADSFDDDFGEGSTV